MTGDRSPQGAADRERSRRLALVGKANPMALAQLNYARTPGWDAFFGSEKDNEEDAAAAGMGYRVNYGGIGQRPDYSGGGRLTASDRTGIAENVALGDLADQNRVRLLSDQAIAQQMQQDALNGMETGYEKQVLASAVPHGPAPITRETVDASGGLGYTMRPSPEETPRQRLASLLPGEAQPAFAAQTAALDDKAAADALLVRKQTEVERENRAKDAVNAPFAAPVDKSGTPLTGEAVMQTLSPAKQNLVKAVLAGKQMVPTGAALKDPYWKGVIEAANLVDPNFDTVDYNARAKTRQDFTSGKAAGQINAINTVIGHLSDLSGKGEDLGNTDLNWVNSVYNALTPGGTKRGVAINDFETLKEGVANELMRVWRQVGAGSEKEIEDWKATIGSTKSPQELRGAFKTIGGMLESKLDALDSQYKQGMGTDKVSAIMPASRERLNKLETGGAPRANPFRK